MTLQVSETGRLLRAVRILTLLMGLFAPGAVWAQGAGGTLSYSTSWIGNTFGGAGTVPGTDYHEHVQIGADDVFVAPDGTVYTDTGWDENGLETGFYRDGRVAGAMEELSHGWGRSGGSAVTANDRYVFAATAQNGDDGANTEINKNGLPQYPPPRAQWDCVRRFTRDGRSAPWPQGAGWKNDMLIVNTVRRAEHGPFPDEAVQGLAAGGQNRLYVGDPAHGQVKVYNAETMAPIAQWPCTRPGKLAAQGTRLWVLQTGARGGTSHIVCLDTRTGKLLPAQVTGTPGWDPQGIAVDNRGRLFVADSGPDQDVKMYVVRAGAPRLAGTFGAKGGIYAAQGRFGARRFNMPVGAGTDRRGNLYVYSRGSVAGGGTVLECYAPGGKLAWRLAGLNFIDCAEPDPASETDVYTKEERFTLDYGKTTPGGEWSYRGYTVNRLKFPDDPRLHTAPTAAFVRRIGGRLFLFTTDMYSGELAVSRFNAQTDGECGIPSVMFAKSHFKENDRPWPATQPAKGEWIWRDANGDGRMGTNEYDQPAIKADAPDLWGWCVDRRGDVWQATDRDGLRRFPCGGLDPRGNPIYRYDTLEAVPMPAPFTELGRVEYVPETDTMFLGGYTTEHPHSGGEWGTVGTEIIRYDHWSRGNRMPTARIVLPYDGKKDSQLYIKPMCVAGDYVFAVEGREPSRVFVYDAKTGALQGTIQPGPQVGKSSGWVDTPYGVRAYKRKNGEYLIFTEEDLDAKVILYRWKPAGTGGAVARQ